MANKRVFYAVKQIGFSKIGENTFTSAHGVQSIGMNTTFNLEQIFEMGQISIYEQVENIPDVEITTEKVLDGYPLLYHLATNGATSATLNGRSTTKCIVGISIYTDTQDSASGVPLAQTSMSGVFVSSLSYTIPTEGNATESVTLVGNNQVWNNSFTPTAFNNNDEPLAIAGSGGVQRRENIKFGATDTTNLTASLLPTQIPGITSSGTNEQDNEGIFGTHISSISASTDLGREELFELGRRGPYFRFASFPTEVRCEIETISIQGHNISAEEENENNLTNERIVLKMDDGTTIDLGTQNKLSGIQTGGADAGQQGGFDTDTYSYVNFNDMTVTHPEDPSGL